MGCCSSEGKVRRAMNRLGKEILSRIQLDGGRNSSWELRRMREEGAILGIYVPGKKGLCQNNHKINIRPRPVSF